MSDLKDFNEKGPLPKGWKTKISKTTGKRYYTKSQYERPTNAMSTAPVANVVKKNVVSGGPNSIRPDPVVTAPAKVNIPVPVPAIDWKKLKDKINSKIEKKFSDERSGGWMRIQQNVKYNEEFKNAIINEINAGREVSLDVVKMFLELKDKENKGPYPSSGGVGGGRHTRKQHGGAIPPPWSLGRTPYAQGLTTNKDAKWTEELKAAYDERVRKGKMEDYNKRALECYQELKDAAELKKLSKLSPNETKKQIAESTREVEESNRRVKELQARLEAAQAKTAGGKRSRKGRKSRKTRKATRKTHRR